MMAEQLSPDSWDGVWRGEFGARSDFAVTVRGGRIISVTMLGQALPVAHADIAPTHLVLSGPDGSLLLQRVGPETAQATYTNNRGKKAAAMMTRRG